MKRKNLLVGLTLIGCWGCSGGNESELRNVFGDDQRTTLDVTTYPGRALARLPSGCSAVMVGSELAMTAVHCLYDSENVGLRTDIKKLQVGYQNGRAVHEVWIESVWLGTKQPVEERKMDWAILRLREPVGDQTGWFGISSESVSDRLPMTVNLAGYATDRDGGETPLVHENCYIHKIDDEGRYLHDCDAVTGVSGGPLYTQSDAGATLVGLSVSEFRVGSSSMTRDAYTHQFANIGVGMADVRELLTDVRRVVGGSADPGPLRGYAYYLNLNANTGGDDSGNDGTEPSDGDRADSQLVLQLHVWDHSTSIIRNYQYLLDLAMELEAFAWDLTGRSSLFRRAEVLANHLDAQLQLAYEFALSPRGAGRNFDSLLAGQRGLATSLEQVRSGQSGCRLLPRDATHLESILHDLESSYAVLEAEFTLN